jgi:hypothetical protein
MNDVPPEDIKATCKSLFETICQEAEWARKLGMDEMYARLQGEAMGVVRLRHALLPFDDGSNDRKDPDDHDDPDDPNDGGVIAGRD